jgi:hypothetical protein
MTRPPLITQFRIIYWRLRDTARRCRRALAYARGHMDRDQANDVIFDCQAAAGWYPLETLSVDSCLQTALGVHWQDHPELESLVQYACDRVASKWDSNGHAAGAAEDWALDLIQDFARARGIQLTPLAEDLEEALP